MKHSTKRPTKAEAARMAVLKTMLCIACSSLRHYHAGVVEIHHLKSGNKRRGHLYTIPLCRWCHQGQHNGAGVKYMETHFGPSLARSPKRFHEVYGSDEELLAATNKLLGVA